MTRRLITIGLLAAGLALAFPRPAAAIQEPSCNGGPCGGGWYRENVTVSWSTGCGSTTVTNDTGGQAVSCTVGTVTVTVVVKKDSTPPGVTANVSRGPDSNGWYTNPLPVTFSGEDGASGVASCQSGTYSGPDGAAISLSGTCTDHAGNMGSGSTTIKYDSTPPTVAGAANRPPDANGWYNHAVQVDFKGSDGGSGVAECTPPVVYKGPDADPAKLVGQCRDAAGHLSAPIAFELRYDGTPPSRPKVALRTGSGSVALTWTVAKDVVLAEIVRAPGLRGKKAAVVFHGKGHRWVDRKAKAATRYWYEVKVFDQAGNRASATVNRKPLLGIFSPAEGAVVRGAPVVAWAPVKKARFYNVQLWLKRVKLLTTWPATARLALPETWTFEGKRRRLVNGRYRLFVWPAFGTLKNPNYGKLVGQVGFVVRRR